MFKLIEVEEVQNDEDVKEVSNGVRFRTFKVYKTIDEKTLNNGDLLIQKSLVGRVTAVTVPADDELNHFYADFSFCSVKDKFSKVLGQEIALERLEGKINNGEDVYIVSKNDNCRITDILREIIATDFSDKITWMRDVKSCDVM